MRQTTDAAQTSDDTDDDALAPPGLGNRRVMGVDLATALEADRTAFFLADLTDDQIDEAAMWAAMRDADEAVAEGEVK